eukprot:COSAG01_NODE_10_length_42970_cov_93.010007_45_plen_99_part_00
MAVGWWRCARRRSAIIWVVRGCCLGSAERGAVLLSYHRYLGLAGGRCNSLRSWASSVTGSLGLGVPLEMGALPPVRGARPRPAGVGLRAAARAACTAC